MRLAKTGIPYLSHAWNPEVGCRNGCPYCWARSVAKRFGRCPKCRTFEPHMHAERLPQPQQTKRPCVVGVCFMGDVAHLEADDRMNIYTAANWAPQHQYVWLTRMPTIFGLVQPRPNWWVGTTADDHVSHITLGGLRGLAGAGWNTWLSMEPWGGGQVDGLDGLWRSISFLAVGCISGRAFNGDESTWHGACLEVVHRAQAAGVPVFVKQVPVGGKCSKEPLDWPADLRVQEVPTEWAETLKGAKA